MMVRVQFPGHRHGEVGERLPVEPPGESPGPLYVEKTFSPRLYPIQSMTT